jgi:hypothetical protein
MEIPVLRSEYKLTSRLSATAHDSSASILQDTSTLVPDPYLIVSHMISTNARDGHAQHCILYEYVPDDVQTFVEDSAAALT